MHNLKYTFLTWLNSRRFRQYSVVKLWDLRKTFSKRINPPSIEESMDYTPVSSFDVEGPTPSSFSTFSSSSSSLATSSLHSSSASSAYSSSFATLRTTRTHGISSLCLSPDGSRLYALSTNSKYVAFFMLHGDKEYELTRHYVTIQNLRTRPSLSFAPTSFTYAHIFLTYNV